MSASDARALLAVARKERRLTHLHASYTSSGNLLCNLCQCPIKSEAAWGSHLHSTGHTLRLSREQDAAAARGAENANGKKRKAGGPVDGQEAESEDRKKAKGPEMGHVEGDQAAAQSGVPRPDEEASVMKGADPEADLDALEADLAALEREHRATAASNATTSAPALTAEELAAQAREEQSAQRGKKDAELEDEREEAARHLEEEFAEMETLEDRVRKLRERREKLRIGATGTATDSGAGTLAATGPDDSAEQKETRPSDNDDDDESDEDDEWAFGAR